MSLQIHQPQLVQFRVLVRLGHDGHDPVDLQREQNPILEREKQEQVRRDLKLKDAAHSEREEGRVLHAQRDAHIQDLAVEN
jgi:hypothetical protein